MDRDKPNTPNSDVQYSIVGGNEAGKFGLESAHRAALVIRKPLDYDTGDKEFSLTLMASVSIYWRRARRALCAAATGDSSSIRPTRPVHLCWVQVRIGIAIHDATDPFVVVVFAAAGPRDAPAQLDDRDIRVGAGQRRPEPQVHPRAVPHAGHRVLPADGESACIPIASETFHAKHAVAAGRTGHRLFPFAGDEAHR